MTNKKVGSKLDKLSIKEKRALLRKMLNKQAIQFYSLSALQEQIWLEEQQYPATARYHISLSYTLQGEINTAALKKALEQLAKRHAMLRVKLVEQEGQTWQQISPHPQIDFSVLLEDDATSAKQILQSIAFQPFNLLNTHLWRVRLARVSAEHHQLLFVFHHMIFDGLSQTILEEDLRILYAEACESTKLDLPLITDGYERFVLEQSKFLQSQEAQKQIHYWQETLQAIPTAPPLVTDPIQIPENKASTKAYSYQLPSRLVEQSQALAESTNTSLNMVLVTIFECLLWRYTQQNTFIVGGVFSQRPLWAKNVIGMFVNTLPLVAVIKDDDTFISLLHRVREHALKAYAHADLPFSQIVAHASRRKANQATHLHIMFNLEPTPEQEQDWHGGLNVIFDGILETAAPKFDLNLFIRRKKNAWYAHWEFNAKNYQPHTIRQLNQSFQILLTKALEDPIKRLGELPLLTTEERQSILAHKQDLYDPLPNELTFITAFAQLVKEVPHATAVRDNVQLLTYRQLDDQSNQFARYLRDKGVQSETVVAILMPHRVETVIAILGVLKIGAIYLPLDANYPKQRLEFMLADSNSQVLLTMSALSSWLQTQADIISLDSAVVTQQISQKSAEALPPLTTGTHLAYIIYTSGSTGQPKGVLIEHQQLFHYLQWCLDTYFSTPAANVPLFTSLAFDLSITSLFGTLLAGHTLWLIDSDGVAEWLSALCEDEQPISLLKLTPSHLDILNQLDDIDSLAARVSKLIVGGEALSTNHIVPLLTSNPDLLIFNEYGPTEVTVGCCVYKIDNLQPLQGKIPIGKPIDRTQLYVLDDFLEPVPLGVKGELYIAGAGLARAYLKRPEQTAVRFTENPFETGRMYKTGDIVQYLPDGNLMYIGRNDSQIKRLGYRIELGEIEQVLLAQTGVKQAAVLVNQSRQERDATYLIAYYTAKTHLDLRTQLEAILPAPMLPDQFVRVEQFPLTTNGKIDRDALEKIRSDEHSTTQQATALPQNPVHDRVASVWQNIMGIEHLPSIDQDFFRLGGNSLQLIQVRAQLFQIFDKDISLRDMFQNRTIHAIAKLLEDEKFSTSLPETNEDMLNGPLSGMQEQIWLEEELKGASARYHIPIIYTLYGTVDAHILQLALCDLSNRHKILTSRLIQDAKDISQSFEKTVLLDFEKHDVSSKVELENRIAETIKQPFDLYQAPLWRVRLLHVSDNEHKLLFVFHHLIFDGQSQGILEREIASLYTDRQAQTTSQLPTLLRGYLSFAIHQRNLLNTQNLESSKHYWRTKLSQSSSRLSLPYDHPVRDSDSQIGARWQHSLPSSLIQQVQDYAVSQVTTVHNVFLAVFEVLLWRYSHQTDFFVGIVMSQRPSWATDLIGMFVNTLPLHAHISPEMSFIDLTQAVDKETLSTYSHSALPFPEIIAQNQRSGANQSLIQAMFSLQDNHTQKIAWGELEVQRGEIIDTHTNKFDLTLTIYKHGNMWHSSWEYDASRFNESTIARLNRHFEHLLANLLLKSDQSLPDFPLLTDAEQHHMHDFNVRYLPLPKQETVVSLFQKQVSLSPNALAASDHFAQLSYQELDEASNKLAHALRAKGLLAEDIVALLLPRRVDILIAILAVLKAGGAYLPLDTEYPTNRLQFILEDSQAKFLITHDEIDAQLMLETKAKRLFLNNDSLMHYPQHALTDLPAPSQLAYVIYTSGSTGIPKGVMIEHRNIINLIKWHQHDFRIEPSARAAILSNFAFDSFVWDFYPYITIGASLHIVDATIRTVPEELFRVFRQQKISHVFMITPLLEHLLNDLEQTEDLPLKYIFTGGDKLQKSPTETLSFTLVNNYGPTEATVVSTSGHVQPNTLDRLPTIGKPIPNTQLYILDPYMALVPQGLVGEIYIGGASVGRGYLNREEETRKRFLSNPFSDDPTAKLYRTGDLARYLPDGQIAFVGRIDHQVKIRGHRIEIGEIEYSLSQHPQIVECRVIVDGDQATQKMLIAYMTTTTQTTELALDDLMNHLRQSLPEYMIPSHYIPLDTFPLTPNGKIDHNQLPKPNRNDPNHYITLTSDNSQKVLPRNAIETIISRIWQTYLHNDRIYIHNNFFTIGGYSLIAAQIIAEIQQTFHITITMKMFFENPTIANLAKCVKEQLIHRINQLDTKSLEKSHRIVKLIQEMQG